LSWQEVESWRFIDCKGMALVGMWPTMAADLTRHMMSSPLWREEDLGRPMPDSPHAVSMCLPTWDSVIGYEEQRPEILAKLFCGYPRFVLNPLIRRLHEQWREAFAPPEAVEAWVYPCEGAARRCLASIRQRVATAPVGVCGCGQGAWMVWVGADDLALAAAKEFWRLAGEGVSSRLADGLLRGEAVVGTAAHEGLRAMLAAEYGVAEAAVYLFPTGMAAAYTAHRFLEAVFQGRSTIQLDFPYVDIWRVQKRFTRSKPRFLCPGSAVLTADLRRELERQGASGVFAEVPSNPLLRTVDLPGVAEICAGAGIPLVVDDTVASVRNVRVLPYADFVTTSLTKWFSGVGDVMGGSLVVREDSLWAEAFAEWMRSSDAAPLAAADAAVLHGNARDFRQRMVEVNANGLRLARYLEGVPELGRVYYPCLEEGDIYADLQRKGGGCGGLVSVVFQGGEETARRFYDALAFCKGPSLGTDFTMVCPYTLLAHYDELDWAQKHGVDRALMRFSVGRESWPEIQKRVDTALEAIRKGEKAGG